MLNNAIEKVFKTKSNHRVEYQLPQGKWIDWLLVPELSKEGEVKSVISSARDITDRKNTETQLIRKDNLLHGISEGVAKLLSYKDFNLAINDMLATVGKSADVDRVYIFENSIDIETGEYMMNQKYEWVANGVTPFLNDKKLQNLKYNSGFERWFTKLAKGKTINGIISDFPITEQLSLARQDIVSIIVVPIIIN